GQLNKRQGEIYNYFRQQLYQEKEWENLKDLSPSQRKGLVEVLYKSRKLTKDEHQRILKQANQAYREEVTGQLSQLRYYKEKIGARSLNKYYHNNPTPHTRKYYFQALQKLLRTTTQRGERVPDEEVELDRYGNPKVKAGQVIVLDSDKPGRRWSVYKKVPSLEEIVKKEVHDEAQEQYILTEGTSLEIQT
ncbi:13753_t:CDS:2, partial [Cetraspora pellucida]